MSKVYSRRNFLRLGALGAAGALAASCQPKTDADKRPGFLQSSRHFLRGNLRRIVCHPIDLSSLLESAGNLNNAGQP